MFKVVKGDLLFLAGRGDFDVIVHGCNCFNIMGAGIAKVIKGEIPEAYQADNRTVRGDMSKLGGYSLATVSYRENKKLTVINAYVQYSYGRKDGERYLKYWALRNVLKKVSENFKGDRIGLPRIGSGLAGGDPVYIESIMRATLIGCDVTLVDWGGSPG